MTTLSHRERVAVARLHALLELLPTALDKELSDTGLTSFEYTLLESLAEAADGRMRLSALASRTNATLPRLSRVATGLERKGLIVRAACEDDGRATNAVLTDAGRAAVAAARPRYAGAVRRMILDGLDADGVDTLADLTYGVLTKLDPDRRLTVTIEGDPSCAADPGSVPECAADPVGPADAECAADPAASDRECAADPAELAASALGGA